MNLVGSVTSGTLKASLAAFEQRRARSVVCAFGGKLPARLGREFPGELQFSGRELIVVDCQPAVELVPP